MEQIPNEITKNLPPSEKREQFMTELALRMNELGTYAAQAEKLPDSDPKKAELLTLVWEGLAKIEKEEAALTAHVVEVITALESHGLSKADDKEQDAA